MNRYMPLTGHDCTIPALTIDTQAPLDVLLDAAAYRIRAVTQLLENIAFREELSSDAIVLHDFAQLLAIPLRDGCDLMDVIGRKLSPQAAQAGTGRLFGRPASRPETSVLAKNLKVPR